MTGVPELPADSNGLVPLTQSQAEEWATQACEGWSAEPELLPSTLVFVVDVSGTMNSGTRRLEARRSMKSLATRCGRAWAIFPQISRLGSRFTRT